MGEKSSKEEAKLEKKRLKTEMKLEKKRAKEDDGGRTPATENEPGAPASPPSKQQNKTSAPAPAPSPPPPEKIPWYKNPEWIRAIAGIASLIVAVIAILLKVY